MVPLPFKAPEDEIEDDPPSIATFADDEIVIHKKQPKHLSGDSALLRRLSGRSNRSSKKFSNGEGNSKEDLVIPHGIDSGRVSRASSLAATIDGLSDDEDMRSIGLSVVHVPDLEEPHDQAVPDTEVEEADIVQSNEVSEEMTERLSSGTEITDSLDPIEPKKQDAEKPAVQESFTLMTDPQPVLEKATVEPEETEKLATADPSVISAVESKPATLTEENLPPQLSKVVMTYRTNEWAKHLSTADAPDLEDLKLAEYPAETEPTIAEVAAPVNVEELQRIPEDAAPPSRWMSQMSNDSQILTRSSSTKSKIHPFSYRLRHEASNGESIISRSTSQLSFHGPPRAHLNTRSLPFRSSSTPIISQPIIESPIEEEFGSSIPNLPSTSRLSYSIASPYGSTSMLIGQRDSMIRGRSSQYNTAAVDDNIMSSPARHASLRPQQAQTFKKSTATVPFGSHQPHLQPSIPHPLARQQQLASFRASIQHEIAGAVPRRQAIERQRSVLWRKKETEEYRQLLEVQRRGARDSAFEERMRRGDMLEAHREALRRMQRKASERC